MATQDVSVVSVIQIAGYWCAVKMETDETMEFIGNPLTEKITAVTLAKVFAEENKFPYRDSALTFNKPVVTIWRVVGCWVPVKLFETCIVGAGRTVEDKTTAILMAEQIALRDGLECFPSIGESVFSNTTPFNR